MSRKLEAGTLIIASHNAGKIIEINDLIKPFGLEAIAAGDLNLAAPEETETTFAGNARIKAHAAARSSGVPALADDSGLEIAALDGAPGVYSADWAGASGDFVAAMARIEQAMQEAQSTTRSARFVCCLCVAWPDGHDEIFLGTVNGKISFPPRGVHGFGYDPIFIPNGRTSTFAQMDPAEKHALSHRADAFAQLVTGCLKK